MKKFLPKRSCRDRQGAVLIFALWVLSFLAVLALNLGFGIRQKITFAKRIETRSQMNHIAEGGMKVAVALLLDDLQKNDFQYSAAAKAFRHNNPARFEDIHVADGRCEIGYMASNDERRLEKQSGFIDEEGKININTADKLVLKKIVALALSLDEESSTKLSEAIFDWRQSGDSELKGFYSEDYYASLQFPYPKKNEPFEIPDELLLIKGIDRPTYEILRSYLTVYGDGHVNINTASKAVLMALGLDDATADKLLKARRGGDGLDNTLDDHIFERTFDIASDVAAFIKLTPEEVKAIDQLNQRGLITTNSYYYTIESNSFWSGSNDRKHITCVVGARENRIVYWNEK
jgi:type II secretory pathway component PulK